jgi:hypothetical protein
MSELDKMTLRLAAQLLELAGDSFSNHGCGDLDIPLEYLELVRVMIANSDYPEDEPDVHFDTGTICVMDWMAMNFCAKMLMQLAREDQ